MANPCGGLLKTCPLCGEPIGDNESRVTYSEPGPMFAMTVHRGCRDIERAVKAISPCR